MLQYSTHFKDASFAVLRISLSWSFVQQGPTLTVGKLAIRSVPYLPVLNYFVESEVYCVSMMSLHRLQEGVLHTKRGGGGNCTNIYPEMSGF
jgi:hypothetical protein